jgi:lipopolysaccharide transport system ATP-binding protein
MGAVLQLCDKGIVLNSGFLNFYGEIKNSVNFYLGNNLSKKSVFKGLESSSKPIWFKSINPCDENQKIRDDFFHDEPIFFDFDFNFNIDIAENKYSLFFIVLDENKSPIFSAESEIIRNPKVKLRIEPNFLVRGVYSIHAFLHKPKIEQVDVVEDVCTFTIIDNESIFKIHGDYDYGRVFAPTTWLY